MKAHTLYSKTLTASLITILAKAGTVLKVSFIIGSFTAFFSASSMMLPLTGAFGGILGSTVGFMLTLFLRGLSGSVFNLHFLAYHIPGFFASAYWARPNRWFSLGIPLLCMILFIAHPAGYYAAPYAFYWLIPMAISFVSRKSIFLHSLSSTFIAHAVGSVIWIYTTPTTPAFWYALLPIVIVERLVMASGMTIAYGVFDFLMQQITKIAFLNRLPNGFVSK